MPNDQAGLRRVNLISISLTLKVINIEHGESQSSLLHECTRAVLIAKSNLLKSLAYYVGNIISKCD